MKKTLAFLLMLLVSFALLAVGLVDDRAGVLGEEEKAAVEAYLALCEEDTGLPVYINTVEGVEDPEAYIDAYTEDELAEATDYLAFFHFVDTGSCYILSLGEASDVVGDWGLRYILDWIETDMYLDSYLDAYEGVGFAFRLVYGFENGEEYGYVSDYAGLLSQEERREVEKALLLSSEQVGFPVLLLTDTSSHGKSNMAYADDYQESYGYEDSILLFVNMGERGFWETTMGDAIDAFSDRALLALEDRFVPGLSSGNYKDAFLNYASGVVDLAWMDSYSSTGDNDYYYGGSSSSQEDEGLASGFMTLFVLSLIVGLISGGVGIGIMKKKMKGAVLVDDASDYAKLETFQIHDRKDIFLYSNVTRVKIESSSSSGGGHSTHHSSSGVSHGGHGGRF